MKFDVLKAALVDMSWKESALLADAAHVPRPTVAKIRYGITTSPRVGTVEKLAAALHTNVWKR